MATMLTDQLTRPFKPEEYRNACSEKPMKVIEVKANGRSSKVKTIKVVRSNPTVDLMAQLKASLGKPQSKKAS